MDYDRDDGGSINSSLMDGEDSISEDEDAIGGWDNEEDFWDDDSVAEEESARVDAPANPLNGTASEHAYDSRVDRALWIGDQLGQSKKFCLLSWACRRCLVLYNDIILRPDGRSVQHAPPPRTSAQHRAAYGALDAGDASVLEVIGRTLTCDQRYWIWAQTIIVWVSPVELLKASLTTTCISVRLEE